jgi:hypothetical protein
MRSDAKCEWQAAVIRIPRAAGEEGTLRPIARLRRVNHAAPPFARWLRVSVGLTLSLKSEVTSA